VSAGEVVSFGLLVALSSTAIVLAVLADRGETNKEPGQVGLGLLIFQTSQSSSWC
jgi:CPA2 family monovalent cation:H+ antiporter-2